METYPPGILQSHGLGYEDLARENPGLVYVSLTPFGQTGPWNCFRADALTLDALSGTMYFRGETTKPPLKMGGMVAECVGGIAAYTGALTGLFYRQRTGQGQHVDVSNREALFSLAESYTSYYVYMGSRGPSRF